MERVSFDRVLTSSESNELSEFMALHPELAKLHVSLNFKGIKNKTKIPFGTAVEFDHKTQVPLSILPNNMSQCSAVFEIEDPFSEIAFLRNDKLQEQTKAFHQKLGKGPELSDVAFKHVLPESMGKDLHSWSPYLGKGFVVIGLNPEKSSDEHQSFLLHVYVPKLPVVSELFSNAYYNSDVPAAKDLAEHPVGTIARELVSRNACKVADAFSQTFGVNLRHRRPSLNEKKDILLPVPLGLSLNPGPVRIDDTTVKLASGLVAWGYNPHCGSRAVYSVGAVHPMIIANRPTRMFLPCSAAETGQPNTVGREIGHAFVSERMFSGQESSKLHPRVANSQKNKELEEFISKNYGSTVYSSKPKMLFLHK